MWTTTGVAYAACVGWLGSSDNGFGHLRAARGCDGGFENARFVGLWGLKSEVCGFVGFAARTGTFVRYYTSLYLMVPGRIRRSGLFGLVTDGKTFYD